MKTSRIEAFSDGVLAIIITIMVLELKAPHGDTISVLIPLLPEFLSYVLSFIYIGIYWNNHHHMLQTTEKVTGGILWAICICYFGSRFFPYQQHGWEKITSLHYRHQFMGLFCSWQQ
jgi:uncharacterized membrane protein